MRLRHPAIESKIRERTGYIARLLRASCADIRVHPVSWNEPDWLTVHTDQRPGMLVGVNGWGHVAVNDAVIETGFCPRRIASNTLRLPETSDTDAYSVAHYLTLVINWVGIAADLAEEDRDPFEAWELFHDWMDGLPWFPDPRLLMFEIQAVGVDYLNGTRDDLVGESGWALDDIDLVALPRDTI